MEGVEKSRKVTITVNAQPNGTLEFTIAVLEGSAEDGTFGAKYDLLMRVCSVSMIIAAANDSHF